MTLDTFLAALGPEVVQPGAEAGPAYLTDWTSSTPVIPLAVLRPRTVREVSRALTICNAQGIAVVPQGGRTGLAGGARPLEGGVVISLDRLIAAPEIDAAARLARVQAGVTLEVLQQAAAAQGLMFPVDIGSRGSCQIGGMISTNAGGMRAFREGVMRQNVLGIEAVLPDGRVLRAMNGFLKNNTGYDLKQLFIGAEGTLGVVTGAVLRLRRAHAARVTALLATGGLNQALGALALLEERLQGLAICEIMWPGYYRYACGLRDTDPLPGASGPVLLIEAEGAEEASLRGEAEAALMALFEAGLIADGALAQNLRQAGDFWALREANEALYQTFGSVVGFDLSLAPAGADQLVTGLEAELAQLSPALRCLWFGHLGDLNLHLGVVDAGRGPIAPDLYAAIEEKVLAAVIAAGGSISAEHGIGAAKTGYVPRIRSTEEQAVSHALRDLLDPNGIMNPGRLF